MIVRPGREADADLLPDVESSAGEAFLESHLPWIAEGDLVRPDVHRKHIAAGTHWVAEAEDGRLAGFVACEALADRLHVWELAVRRDRQRQGLGSRLIAAAVEAARARGLPMLTLTTFRSIAWNAPYYARLGFQELDPADDPWVAKVLAHEADIGLPDRLAMKLAL
jgi:GNAT superfamily N-acetyltransferase